MYHLHYCIMLEAFLRKLILFPHERMFFNVTLRTLIKLSHPSYRFSETHKQDPHPCVIYVPVILSQYKISFYIQPHDQVKHLKLLSFEEFNL